MKRLALLVVAGAALLSLISAGVSTPSLIAQSAEFTLDVTVTDKEGGVADLKMEELQIQDDGKRATITKLTPVVARGSAAQGDGREIVILLDDSAAVPMSGTPALQQLATIFASPAGPGDHVSVIRMHNASDDLTTDRQVALAKIAAFSAGVNTFTVDETPIDTFKVVARLATKLGQIAPNRRKAIVCVGSDAICNPLERDPTAPRDEYPSWVNALAATARNNVVVYAAVPSRAQLMGAGLPQRTGGQSFTGPNFTAAVERVYNDISQYYMVNYTVEASKKEVRNISVRTTRKNTTVKARDKRGK